MSSRATVHEQFSSAEVQRRSVRLGMWVFLGSETLLFAALFALYLAYRILYGADFSSATAGNHQLLGTLNTVILISSSLTVALAVSAVREGRHRRVTWLLAATLLLATAFLGVKAYEYATHFSHGIYPGALYSSAEHPTQGARFFFTLYFFLTGLHALHVLGGMVALAIVGALHRKDPTSDRTMPLELVGLYWHLVDAVWIVLWPLFYLLR